MDAAQALAELVELSSQVERAVVIRADGSVLAATTDDVESADALARAALDLVAAAHGLHAGQAVTRVDVELADGAVFVLQEGDRTIAATTGPRPTTGLVVYDLRTCLHRIDKEAKPRRKRAVRKPEESE
ncbi:MAG TPA: roadblock/LC7 domain-containing protein [Gaiellaceae bacterium]|nr:roadblock/LC7 domain-containing protein [Gaiellaceae bacterium]